MLGAISELVYLHCPHPAKLCFLHFAPSRPTCKLFSHLHSTCISQTQKSYLYMCLYFLNNLYLSDIVQRVVYPPLYPLPQTTSNFSGAFSTNIQSNFSTQLLRCGPCRHRSFPDIYVQSVDNWPLSPITLLNKFLVLFGVKTIFRRISQWSIQKYRSVFG